MNLHTHLVRQLEKPAAGDVHIVVGSIAIVIGGLAAFGATSSSLWGHTSRSYPVPAPACSKGQGMGWGKGLKLGAAKLENGGEAGGRRRFLLGFPPMSGAPQVVKGSRIALPSPRALVEKSYVGTTEPTAQDPPRDSGLTSAGGKAGTAVSRFSLVSVSGSEQPSSSTW